MEIPQNLKSLYNHWELHTTKPQENNQVNVDKYVLDSIDKFITERMRIWEAKSNGIVPPYTKDPILEKYRFCNIYRELDKQTIEIHSLLKSSTSNFSFWLLNVLFCRLVCNVDTVKKVGLLSFEKGNNKLVFKKLKSLPSPKYGTAYVFPISVIQKSNYPTREEFFCFYLPEIVNRCAESIKQFDHLGVNEALSIVLPIFGFKLKFHWTEVFIDIAYQYPHLIDLYKVFPVGPGSLPTMKLLNPNQQPELTCLNLVNNKLENFPYLTFDSKPIYLSAENWEGIGCEYRKYLSLTSGQGRKRIYKV